MVLSGWRFAVGSMWAPVVAVVASATCQLFFLLGDAQLWRGEYLLSTQWITANAFPALLVVALAIGVDFAVNFRGPAPFLSEFGPAFVWRYWLAVCVGFALPLVGALVYVSRSWMQLGDPLAYQSFIYFLLCLGSFSLIFAFCVVLSLVSSWFGVLISPIFAAVIGFVGLDRNGLVNIGGASGSLLNLQYKSGFFWLSFVSTVLALALMVFLLRRRQLWEQGVRSVSAWVALGLVAIFTVSGLFSISRFEELTSRHLACVASDVCVDSQHFRLLRPLWFAVESVRAQAAEVGVDDVLPDRVVEAYASTIPGDRLPAQPFDPGADPSRSVIGPRVAGWAPSSGELEDPESRVSPESVMQQLAIPYHCTRYSSQLQQEVRAAGLALIDSDLPLEERQQAADFFRVAFPALQDCDA